jgi:SAM-dependent methyltransferase
MDAPLKKILRALSLELRHTLEGKYSEDGTWNAGDLERRLNQIGIWRDRHVKPVSEMPNLSPVDRRARELIDAYLALRSDAGVLQSDAVAEFIRESAYSWANRLFALRCMEARGIIDPVILQEEAYHGRSMVHDRFAQTNPTQCTDEDDGLFMMLSEEFRERSQELPDLFAPDSPAVTLRPSVVALKHCIALLSGSAPANGGRATDDVFTAPDAFGWAYQYWNAEEKDRVFEMVRTKKGAKIEGSDIIPATQLYTEPYMVKFLVQNSLGATWMMMHPESKLSATWEYYVKDADRTPNEKKTVAEITFLDPACGSGHFLIEAFDLLYAMYEDEGQLKGSAAICQSILNNNLFGIDIDERAVQITKAVLWMKAAEAVFGKTKQQLKGDEFSEFHDHIIATNIRLPNGKDHLDAFLKKHPEDAPLRPALLTVYEGLQNVHELGSLVQIEEPVDKELKALKEQAKQQRFDPESGEVVEKVYFPRWKQQVMKRLKAHFQEEAEKALPTEAFFSQSAVKGLALFDLLARRYDVVAANPPYMGSGNLSVTSKRYIDFHYPKGKNDLFSAFILRNIQLLS